jgi:hypothetical protein
MNSVGSDEITDRISVKKRLKVSALPGNANRTRSDIPFRVTAAFIRFSGRYVNIFTEGASTGVLYIKNC